MCARACVCVCVSLYAPLEDDDWWCICGWMDGWTVCLWSATNRFKSKKRFVEGSCHNERLTDKRTGMREREKKKIDDGCVGHYFLTLTYPSSSFPTHISLIVTVNRYFPLSLSYTVSELGDTGGWEGLRVREGGGRRTQPGRPIIKCQSPVVWTSSEPLCPGEHISLTPAKVEKLYTLDHAPGRSCFSLIRHQEIEKTTTTTILIRALLHTMPRTQPFLLTRPPVLFVSFQVLFLFSE